MQVTAQTGLFSHPNPSIRPSAEAETGFSDAENAAGNALPQARTAQSWSESHSGEYKHATRWLSNILNMAGPNSFDSHTMLNSPDMALALHSPSVTGAKSAQPVTYDAGNISLTSEGRAQTIVDELGNGIELSLSEAIDALVVANPGRKENERSVVERYFRKEDTDNSGSLSKTELTRLIDYYDEMARKVSDQRILLPDNWG